MKKILVVLLVAGGLQAGVLDDLESVRASATRRMHTEGIGTAQYTAAEVDSQVNESIHYIATKVDLDPAPYLKVDSIPLVKGQGLYTLESDYVEGGLKYCKRHTPTTTGAIEVFVPVVVLADVVTPIEGAAPSQVFDKGGVLGVHPIPDNYDTLIIWYQALPPAMCSDTSSILIIPKYREMMLLHVCWQIAVTLSEDVDAARFERMYDKERGIVQVVQ